MKYFDNHLNIAAFGEVMFRLSSDKHERIEQVNRFNCSFAGSEANVVVNLSIWGECSKFLTVLPNNVIGNKCLNDIRRFGVNVSNILRNDGRMGLMFIETGVGIRGSNIIYDRKHSAISTTNLDKDYFVSAFKDCNWFHYTGITPALSLISQDNCREAIIAAQKNGLTISVDLNYRSKLWKYGSKAPDVMPELVTYADIIMANEEDVFLSLGIESDMINIEKGILPINSYKKVANKIFSKFPKAQVLAFTLRKSLNASINGWSAILFTRNKFFQSESYNINPIIDRVGAGDSFAAGLILGLNRYKNNYQKILDFATAASCLKHSIQGDYCLVSIAEVESLMKGNKSGRIKR